MDFKVRNQNWFSFVYSDQFQYIIFYFDCTLLTSNTHPQLGLNHPTQPLLTWPQIWPNKPNWNSITYQQTNFLLMSPIGVNATAYSLTRLELKLVGVWSEKKFRDSRSLLRSDPIGKLRFLTDWPSEHPKTNYSLTSTDFNIGKNFQWRSERSTFGSDRKTPIFDLSTDWTS